MAAMMTVQVQDPSNALANQGVDASHSAARVAIRPLDHVSSSGASPGGHFLVTQFSGTIAASLGASSDMWSMRWTDTSKLLVLVRLSASIGVYTAAQTVANPLELEAYRSTGFTTDFTTNATSLALAAGSNKARSTHADSLMAASFIKILTTTGMTGSVKTNDTAGFGCAFYTGAVLGSADQKDLYNILAAPTHPIILGQNMGVHIRNVGAFGAAATYKLGVTAVWAELAAY